MVLLYNGNCPIHSTLISISISINSQAVPRGAQKRDKAAGQERQGTQSQQVIHQVWGGQPAGPRPPSSTLSHSGLCCHGGTL